MPSIPFVLERRGDNDRAMDIYSRLLEERVIFLLGEVNEESANLVVAQMFFLYHQDPKADIHFYINSPGGSVTDGMGVYDVMKYISCDVATYCIGLAASMGSTLLAAGTKGKRLALPHSRVMLHQPYGQVGYGQVTDLEIAAREILRMRDLLEEILSHHTGQPRERVHADTDRDFVMEAQEALEYGIIDDVISSRQFADRSGPIR